jgi:hypothetical protein
LLWPGCVELRARLSGSGGWPAEGAQLIERAGSTVVLADPRCCGEPLLAAGDEEAFAALARANAKLIASAGVRQVITSCPHCAETMRRAYAARGSEIPVPVTDLADWAASRLQARAGQADVALVVNEGGEGLAAALGPRVAGEPIPWVGCGDEVTGPALRTALFDLAQAADERGARIVVVKCTHCTDLVRSAMARGAWRTGPPVTILDGAAALARYASSPEGGAHD